MHWDQGDGLMLCGKRTGWGGKESSGLHIELRIPPYHGLDGERLKKARTPCSWRAGQSRKVPFTVERGTGTDTFTERVY